MKRSQGDREPDGYTKSIIFEFVCHYPDGIDTSSIESHIRTKLNIKKTPIGHLDQLANRGLITKTDNGPGRSHFWSLAKASEIVLPYVFETFESDPERFTQIYNNPGVQGLIYDVVRRNITAYRAGYELYNIDNPMAYEDLVCAFPYSENVHLEGMASLDEGMLVSPSLLRWIMVEEKPPEFLITHWHFITDIMAVNFFPAYPDAHPITHYLSFFMIDMAKYPKQVEKILDYLNRDDVASFIEQGCPRGAVALEKLKLFGGFMKDREISGQ